MGATALVGCTDFLDKDPMDRFTNNANFWNNEASVEGYANTFYNQFAGFSDFYFPELTDDQVARGFANWKFVNVPESNSSWSATYKEIRRSNEMIAGLEAATKLDDATKNHWLGVARLMRAYQYWDLVRKFGDCVWVDFVPDVDDEILYAPRTDRDEVMDHVLDDLNFAVANIQESSDKRYWSRAMAQAMKSHICLWEGTYSKYRKADAGQKAPNEEHAKKFLQECVNASEAIMNSGDFSLGNYADLYRSVSLQNNPEVIFCKEYKKDVMSHETIMYTCMSTMINGMSKDAFDSYLFIDGKTVKDTQYQGTQYNSGVMEVSKNDSKQHLNINNMLAVRDKRLAVQLDTVLCVQGNPWPRLANGTAMTSSTGYGVAKYDNVTLEKNYRESGKNYTSAPLYWLAEIYLNYAEAKAELGTITNEDLNKSVNLLKDRAGLPHITTAVVSPDKDPNLDAGVSDLIFEIRRERRCELMFDNDFRYWDLIRWHQLDKLDTTKNPDIMLGADVTGNQAGATVKTVDGRDYIDGSNGFTRTYDAKNYFYPIPSGQITLNPKLTQNPGW